MKKPSSLKRIAVFIKPDIKYIVFSAVLSLVTVGLTLYFPILIGRAIDCIVKKGDVDFVSLKEYLLKACICVVLNAAFQWLMSTFNNRITFKTVKRMRETVFDKLQKLPVSYIDSHPHGDIVNRMISDIDTFADGLLMGFTQFFTGVMTILGTLIFMFALNFYIALAVVVITPVSLFVAKFISGKTYSMFNDQSILRGKQTTVIEETVTGAKVLKAFGYEDKMLERYNMISENLKKASVKAIFFSSLVNPSTRLINNFVYAAVGAFGALSVIGVLGGSSITVGILSSFLNYANQYTKPFNEISGVITELQNAIACANRVFDFLDAESISDDSESLKLGEVNGDVEIKDVSFSYTPEKPLIRDFNLSVKKGSRVAIVGPTGCGKTTVINLLMRFYDVDGGAIYVDGVNTKDVTRKSLRKNFGLVLQDTFIKNGTVYENISVGNPEASKEEIIAAAKAAHAHGFITRLKNGYDTVISDEGSLSLGQRQLISIARVMLCIPPMLILDEATSSIDTRTELRIQSAFNKMMQGRTSFIVAHRLSTIREADIILVMKDGNIIETGNHEQLLKKKGFYFNLYNSQFES